MKKRLPLVDLLHNNAQSDYVYDGSPLFFDKMPCTKVFAAPSAGAENEIENFGIGLY